MSRRSTTAPLLLALTTTAAACASTPRCGVAPTGAIVRWADVALDPAARLTTLPAALEAPDETAAASGPVFMRFDASGLGGSPVIERAALVLVPSPASRRGRCALLRVRAIDEPWSAASVARGDRPALTTDGAAEVTLPPQRVPVRVDVTALVRALGAEGLARRGLAVTATEDGVTFQGSGTLSPEERPRLEVLLR